MTNMSPIIGITEMEEWDKKWPEIFDHYQQDLRHGYYVNAFISDANAKVLEIGAGSFRDMALLNRLGVDCDGTDFSQTAVDMSRQLFPNLKNKIFQSDAFDFKYIKDKSYDISFHNGLWIYFNDESDLASLISEQARISKNFLFATVHNAHNKSFVDYFKKLSANDALYRIRFFEVEEMMHLMLKACRRVDIIPVGKGKKLYEDDMINRGEHGREELRSFFEKAKMTHLDISERLLCIGYL
jgi:hypothetical protein